MRSYFTTECADVRVSRFGSLTHETFALFEFVVARFVLLLAARDNVLQRRDVQFLVDRLDALRDEFLGIEVHGIDRLVVDPAPQVLELLLLEVRVEHVLLEREFVVGLRDAPLR